MKKIIMLLGMGALVCATACKHEEGEKKEKTKFLVTSPVQMDTTVTKDYVCQIKSIQHIELRAQERGYLEKIYVDEGQAVKKGQLLFQIMPNLYQAEMLKADAEANFAQIEYNTTKKLADGNVVSPSELAMAKAKLDKARADLALSKVHLQFTEIRAPFDGIIDRFHVRLGSLVDEGELLTELSDNSKMWVYYNVPESEYLDFKEKLYNDKNKVKVNLLMANNKMFEYPGVVETIEADFNNETGNIAFRATFPNPKSLLRHGETGNVQMTEDLKGAMLIPQKATFEVLDKKYVYVINKEGRVQSKEITIVAEIPHIFAIKGLTTGDKILLEGLRLVKENEKIEYKFEEPKHVLSHLELYAE